MRLVVFDVDGTLVDSADIIVQLMGEAFTTHGLTVPTPDAIRRTVGLSLETAMASLAGLNEADAKIVADHYRAHTLDYVSRGLINEPLYPGASEAILRLAGHETTLLGVATGKNLRGLKRILGLHDLTDHFVTFQTPDNNPSKPHPGMMLTAMAETGIDESRAVMVGDTSFDMELARAAGGKAIGVSWGYHDRQSLIDAGANLVIDNYEQLDEALETVLDTPHA
ncbi:HAD-IA family hydrolase [Cucumibacter marinus]|uniref:HAD-IA family hydrolase n=1 Tax=Cucumibacter marinus TaxID=1121252 RepID=UPI0004162AEE|nr:HAD-IA family hydrolase [Cucumibacter marinus]